MTTKQTAQARQAHPEILTNGTFEYMRHPLLSYAASNASTCAIERANVLYLVRQLTHMHSGGVMYNAEKDWVHILAEPWQTVRPDWLTLPGPEIFTERLLAKCPRFVMFYDGSTSLYLRTDKYRAKQFLEDYPTAEQVFPQLASYPLLDDESQDEVTAIIQDTSWRTEKMFETLKNGIRGLEAGAEQGTPKSLFAPDGKFLPTEEVMKAAFWEYTLHTHDGEIIANKWTRFDMFEAASYVKKIITRSRAYQQKITKH